LTIFHEKGKHALSEASDTLTARQKVILVSSERFVNLFSKDFFVEGMSRAREIEAV
jgi:hypothetical protein